MVETMKRSLVAISVAVANDREMVFVFYYHSYGLQSFIYELILYASRYHMNAQYDQVTLITLHLAIIIGPCMVLCNCIAISLLYTWAVAI